MRAPLRRSRQVFYRFQFDFLDFCFVATRYLCQSRIPPIAIMVWHTLCEIRKYKIDNMQVFVLLEWSHTAASAATATATAAADDRSNDDDI